MPYRALRPFRRLEWWLASYTLVWGAFLMVFPNSLEDGPHFVMRLWAPAMVWGEAALVVGMFHLWALYINGRRSWSAHVRAAATVLNALIFTLVLSALLAAVWWGIASITLAIPAHAGFVWASLCAFWIAGNDSYSEICRSRGLLNGT